jgi:hypothetical protein
MTRERVLTLVQLPSYLLSDIIFNKINGDRLSEAIYNCTQDICGFLVNPGSSRTTKAKPALR